MGSRSAQEAVMERLGINLSRGESAEFYHELCSLLVARDTHAYVELLRTKYELLKGGISPWECDYMIMESLLETFVKEHPFILTAVAYVVKYKS